MRTMDRINVDAVYDTRTAGQILGGLHPNDVNHLIKAGKIAANLRPVRGKRGRTVIRGRELIRYLNALPEKLPDASPGDEGPPVRRRRRSTRLKASDFGPAW